MRKTLGTLMILSLLTFLIPLNVKANEIIDINTLIEQAKELDGQKITVQGEAIGECMDRGEYSWININDGTNAMGIWMDTKEAANISFYGNSENKGDTIKITGIYHRACKEHGGEADIHNITSEIVNVGNPVKETVPFIKISSSISLSIIAFAMVIIFCKRKSIKE